MPLKALNGYSDNNDIVFVIRDEYGKSLHRIPDFDWYFYADWSLYDVLKNDPAFSSSFKRANGIKSITTEKPYLRIHVPYSAVRDRRSTLLSTLSNLGIKTFEADVDPLKRLMIDSLDVEISDSYRVLFLDIETDDRPSEGNKTNEIVVGERQILSLAGYENEEINFVYNGFDEVEILRAFLKRIKDYDVLVGWNSARFDIPYIQKRIELIRDTQGIDLEREFGIDWRNFIFVDFMVRFKHIYQYDSTLTSFSLAKVVNYFKVGEKIDLHGRSIWDIFEKDPELGRKYNLNDAALLYQLEKKIGVFSQMVAQSRFCRTFLSNFWITELLDNLILKSGKQRRIHLPTKQWTNRTDDSYAGGYVLDPKPGLFNNINIFDYQSLYPNIIRTWNISPDTMTREDVPGVIRSAREGVYFKTDLPDPSDPNSYLGLLPRVVSDLLTARDVFKKKKAELTEAGLKDSTEYESADRDEKIVKELGNSAYGICGNFRSRYYSIDLAESITLAGQHLIKFARDFFESMGFVVCAGDTDSIMVSLPVGSDPKTILDKYHSGLREHLISSFGAKECHIKFKHEKKFARFINVIKKNYVGRVIEEGGKPVDYVYAKGLEMIKKDTLQFTRGELKKIVQQLLYEDHSLDFYTSYIEELRKEVNTREFKVEEISITKKISKDFDAYKTTPSHVLLAKKMWSSEDKEFHVGMNIQYFVLDATDKSKKAAHISEYTGQFDRRHFWEKSVYPPLQRILSVVFKEHDWSNYEKSLIPKPKRARKKKEKEPKLEPELDLKDA